MPKLLIVDDENKIRTVIKEYAEALLDAEVTEAPDGMDAVALVRDNDYDIIVMDVMMPKLDGFSAVKEIKKIKDIPVIMLSARGEEYDKLFGFEVGVDDYVVKDGKFSPKELMARIKVILARRVPAENTSDKLIFDGLIIDILAKDVTIDGNKIELTPKEYDLLLYLVRNKNIALSRDTLLSDIWGYEFGDVRTIDTHVKNLRSYLGPYRNKIATVRGTGYKFEG
ncbi:MAG: response regulator transcription factor [Clostridiales Family XIII bacterium]|jgi:DNA-binding response OmpR family regulator|nr:response regulator transcription factor [Clostridiales Family XIII bacterium]